MIKEFVTAEVIEEQPLMELGTGVISFFWVPWPDPSFLSPLESSLQRSTLRTEQSAVY